MDKGSLEEMLYSLEFTSALFCVSLPMVVIGIYELIFYYKVLESTRGQVWTIVLTTMVLVIHAHMYLTENLVLYCRMLDQLKGNYILGKNFARHACQFCRSRTFF